MSVTESFRITELMIDVGALSGGGVRQSAEPRLPGEVECDDSECNFDCTDPGSMCNDGTGGQCDNDSCLAQTDCDCSVEDTKGCGECDSAQDTQAGLGAEWERHAGSNRTLVMDPPEFVAMRKLLAEALATQDS
jgi:hypothetical protein